MGQRANCRGTDKRIRPCRSDTNFVPQLSIFASDLGWFGLLGRQQCVTALSIGHVSDEEVREAIRKKYASAVSEKELAESDWFPQLRKRLQKYSVGTPCDFEDCDVSLPRLTSFQKKVVSVTRRLEFGQTATYGEIAQRAGSPRAARAVGSVMASNHIPIIIPCHRVIASGGRLGGFSARQGVNLKQRMLAIEGVSF